MKHSVYYSGQIVEVRIHGETLIPKTRNKKPKDCVDRLYYEEYKMICNMIKQCNDKILFMFRTGVETVNLENMSIFGIEDATIKLIKEYANYFSITDWYWHSHGAHDDVKVALKVKSTKRLEQFFGHEDYKIEHYSHYKQNDCFKISRKIFEEKVRLAKYYGEL